MNPPTHAEARAAAEVLRGCPSHWEYDQALAVLFAYIEAQEASRPGAVVPDTNADGG